MTQQIQRDPEFKACEDVRNLMLLGKLGIATIVHIDRESDLMRVESPRLDPKVCRYSLYMMIYHQQMLNDQRIQRQIVEGVR